MIKACSNIQDIVECWTQQSQIEGVQDMHQPNEQFIADARDYSQWMSEPKVIGTRVIKVEVFFTIKSTLNIREFTQDQLEYLKREGIRVDMKRTVNEHTTKVGFIVGPLVDRANVEWCQETLVAAGHLEQGHMELKKEVVYEGEEN